MKKLVLLAMIAALVVPGLAGPTVNLTTAGGGWPQTPYTVNIHDLNDALWVNNGITANFTTFCVQSSQVFHTGVSYTATIDDTILEFPGTALADITKQIYAAYLNDGFSTNYTGNDIQMTIWASLEMQPSSSTTGQSFLALFDADDYDTTGWENVMVLNLWTANGGDAQSQVVRVTPVSTPDPKPIPVPAPGAVLLTGIGTTLVGWLRRRRAL